jgi:hypothetical protein
MMTNNKINHITNMLAYEFGIRIFEFFSNARMSFYTCLLWYITTRFLRQLNSIFCYHNC